MSLGTKQIEITKRICYTALFAALAYVVMLFIRIKPVPFLTYDPKDVVITIFGFMFGPLSSLAVSFIVPLVEMLSASDTGIIGFVMNFSASASFVLPATLIYKYKREFSGAVIGLISGVVSLTCSMLLLNVILTPVYTNTSVTDVIKMIPSLLLPFNLLKGVFNAALIMLLYKPFVLTLKKAGILKISEHGISSKKFTLSVCLVSLFVIAICAVVYFIIF